MDFVPKFGGGRVAKTGTPGCRVAVFPEAEPRGPAEEEFRTLVEQSFAGLCVLREGRLLYVNPGFAALFGYAPQVLSGADFGPLIHPEDRPAVTDWMDRIARDGPILPEQVIRGLRPGGAVIALKTGFRGIRFQGEPALLGSFGDVTREKQVEVELRRLSEQLLAGQEQERRRIAAELHDCIGQYLNALRFGLQDVEPATCAADAAQGRLPPCGVLLPVLRELIEESRRLAANLRPPTLDHLGLLVTLDGFCRRLEEIFPTLRVVRDLDVEENDIPEPLKIVIFRVLQEAVNNVIEHARASRIRVALSRCGGFLEFRVEDDGVGFEGAAASGAGRGFGLVGLRERITLSGGHGTVESSPGAGVAVVARWPVDG
jgi:PAS domain S-box-containing protein